VVPVYGAWGPAGLAANKDVDWRIARAAPLFAGILNTSVNGNERAWAAMGLGGTGDRTYLPLLRRVAAEDVYPHVRALAYRGIMHLLGPESLSDLRVGAKDPHERVRGQAVVDAYNLLELGPPEPRWPPPSSELIAEVRAFLMEMQRDPALLVSRNARSMLALLARPRP
jgi:HEAT repeat protein